MGPVGSRVMLARMWRVSPAELRECTWEEVQAMWAVLRLEDKHRGR